jgi:hypothetical protein
MELKKFGYNKEWNENKRLYRFYEFTKTLWPNYRINMAFEEHICLKKINNHITKNIKTKIVKDWNEYTHFYEDEIKNA